jgi:pyruvate/2-oxoglutarate dehydrogenase complex dihydrolipoamide acyltransferase (E2) component
MARIPVKMPQLGYEMVTGKLSSWLRAVGDHVARGEAIAEVETEKTTVEMEAMVSGTLVEIAVEPDVEVPVGTVIGWIDDES